MPQNHFQNDKRTLGNDVGKMFLVEKMEGWR